MVGKGPARPTAARVVFVAFNSVAHKFRRKTRAQKIKAVAHVHALRRGIVGHQLQGFVRIIAHFGKAGGGTKFIQQRPQLLQDRQDFRLALVKLMRLIGIGVGQRLLGF